MLRTKTPPLLISRHFNLEQNHIYPNCNHPEGKLLALLNQCASTKPLQQIHTQMLINSIKKPNCLLLKLIDLKDFKYASLLFSQMIEPNEYAFNIMIRGLTTTWQHFSLTLQFYNRMKFSGKKPDKFTYPFLLIACAKLPDLSYGRLAHSEIFKAGLDIDGHVNHTLIKMYSMCGELEYARTVFDEITDKEVVSWNSIISGYSKMGFAAEAMKLFAQMRELEFVPDEMTLVSVLGACGDLGDLVAGSMIEGIVEENKVEVNSYIGSALIHMYGKCGDMISARRVFDRIPETRKDIVIWNSMITGYSQNGVSDEAIMLFKSMIEVGVKPNNITLVGVLSACASIGALDLGKWVDEYASKKNLKHDIYISTALIDMYAKCGSLDQALRVFEDMSQKNEVSWNAMISALAFHGRAHEALSLFDRMSRVGGARPNDITFVGLLSACVHVGLVDRGRQLFDSMSSSFGLVPKIEHHSCMVDLLARAGLVEEAWEFIEKMAEKPDEVALGALLGACQKVKNVNVGEKVMKLLLEIESSNSGNYVISSKIYANLRMWDEAARMRALMRQRGVNKTPGCSWIDVENQVHEFHVGDGLHLSSKEIYQIISLLNDDMKMESSTFEVEWHEQRCLLGEGANHILSSW